MAYASTVHVGKRAFTVTTDGQVINDEGEIVTNTPVGRNVLAKAKSGYTQEQEQATEDRQARNREGFRAGAKTLAEFLPGIGDAITAYDTADAFVEGDYATAAILGVALGVGLIPGVGDAIAAPLKAAAKRLPTAHAVGIARALRDGDMEFLRSYKGPEHAMSVGARSAADKTIYIKKADGSVEAVTGTPKELKEKYGINPKALSDKTRNTGRTTEGTQWSKDGEFTDFKTGKTVKQEELTRMDPASIGYSDSRAALPRSFPTEFRDELESIVDNAIVKAEYKYVNRVGLDDFRESKQAALDIAEEAWPEIVQQLKRYDNQFTTEQYNKVHQWAKNRSRSVFDVTDAANVMKKKVASGEIGFTGEYVVQPGAARRLELQRQGKRWSDEKPTKLPEDSKYAGLYDDPEVQDIIRKHAGNKKKPGGILGLQSPSTGKSSVVAPTRRRGILGR